jgi:hypothetical protein
MGFKRDLTEIARCIKAQRYAVLIGVLRGHYAILCRRSLRRLYLTILLTAESLFFDIDSESIKSVLVVFHHCNLRKMFGN